MSCSTFNRHRHDAPAQYDRGRTLYPVADCCCSGCEGAAAGGGSDDAGGADASGNGAGGGDGAVSLVLMRRVDGSSDARLGLEFDFAVAGGRKLLRRPSVGSIEACTSRRGAGGRFVG
jgi:hypothetical protein